MALLQAKPTATGTYPSLVKDGVEFGVRSKPYKTYIHDLIVKQAMLDKVEFGKRHDYDFLPGLIRHLKVRIADKDMPGLLREAIERLNASYNCIVRIYADKYSLKSRSVYRHPPVRLS